MNSTRLFGALFLSSGAALVVYVLSGLSLFWAMLVALLLVALVGGIVFDRATGTQRRQLSRLVLVGVVAGIIATLVYDASRFALIELTGVQFWPFHIFDIFGQALVGQSYHGWWVTALGVGFHLLNGVGFAVAYSIWFSQRGIGAGIIFALALECLMILIYPDWLNITLVSEFLSVSIFGHIAYGITLGALAKTLARQWVYT